MAHSSHSRTHNPPPRPTHPGLPVEYFSGRRAFAQTRDPMATPDNMALAGPRRRTPHTDQARRAQDTVAAIPTLDHSALERAKDQSTTPRHNGPRSDERLEDRRPDRPEDMAGHRDMAPQCFLGGGRLGAFRDELPGLRCGRLAPIHAGHVLQPPRIRARLRGEISPTHDSRLGARLAQSARAGVRGWVGVSSQSVCLEQTELLAVRVALQSGQLIRPTQCERCGNGDLGIQAHHENYERQLDVIWLCRPCHAQRHKELAGVA